MSVIFSVILLSLMGSFVCSLCEAALYAVTPTRVEVLRLAGVAGSRKLSELRERIDEAIAAILTVNSLTQTVGAAWSGALVAETFGDPWLGVFVAVFSLTMLMLTEILPKSLGVAWASELAPRVAWLIQFMIWAVWPLAKFSTLLTRLITRRASGQQPTEEELLVMADLAAEEGAILPEESQWVRNVLRLNNITALDLMTPRSAVHSLSGDLPLMQAQMRTESWVHSRLPVTDAADADRVIGVVQRRVIFDRLAHGDEATTVRELMRPAMFISEKLRGHQLLDGFITQHQHLAVVLDEAGGLKGVVSLEDVLEYLLGRPIVGEHDTHPDMQQLARERSRFHAARPTVAAQPSNRPVR